MPPCAKLLCDPEDVLHSLVLRFIVDQIDLSYFEVWLTVAEPVAQFCRLVCKSSQDMEHLSEDADFPDLDAKEPIDEAIARESAKTLRSRGSPTMTQLAAEPMSPALPRNAASQRRNDSGRLA